jgi:hypothetical protein
MLVDNEYRKRVDGLLRDTDFGLAFAPRSEAPTARRGMTDGSYEVALNGGERALVKTWMHASGADAGLDRTIGRMTGGQFSPAEVKALEDMALKAAEWRDVGTLSGIAEGPPVNLTPAQKAVVDRIMGKLGPDDLAHRARGAYEGAVRAGQVRIR